MAQKNYVPLSDADLDNWLGHFANVLPSVGPSLGISNQEINNLGVSILETRNRINLVVTHKADLKTVVGNKETQKADLMKVLRPIVQRMKNHPDYNDNNQGNSLGIVGVDETPDTSNMKPELRGTLETGKPKVIWKKGLSNGINVYVDRKDGKGFVFLATDTSPDFIDTTPLPVGVNSVVWDYIAVYIINDTEVGEHSEKISITVTKMGA